MKRYKIVNKKRAYTFIALCFIVATYLLCQLVAIIIPTKPTMVGTEHYYVHSGDTLWDIAKEYDGMDARDVMHDIKVLSNLNSADIFVGDELIVPIYK